MSALQSRPLLLPASNHRRSLLLPAVSHSRTLLPAASYSRPLLLPQLSTHCQLEAGRRSLLTKALWPACALKVSFGVRVKCFISCA